MSSGGVLGETAEQAKAAAKAKRFGQGANYEPKGSVLDDPVERKRAEVRARRFSIGS